MDRSFRKGCIVFLCLCMQLYAGNDEELFLSGNKLYGQGQYDKALASYDTITKKGRAVLYNMGNCYYYTGNYAQACVYWARAECGATGQEIRRIAACRQRALQKVGKHHTLSLREHLDYIVHAMVPYASLLFMQLFFLIWWYIGIYCVYRHGRFSTGICHMFDTHLYPYIVCCVICSYKKQCSSWGVIIKAKLRFLLDQMMHFM